MKYTFVFDILFPGYTHSTSRIRLWQETIKHRGMILMPRTIGYRKYMGWIVVKIDRIQ